MKKKAKIFSIFVTFLSKPVLADDGLRIIPNFLASETLIDLFKNLLSFAVSFMVVTLPLAFVLTGLLYTTGGLLPKNVNRGKSFIKWGVSLFVIFLMARAIIEILRMLFS